MSESSSKPSGMRRKPRQARSQERVNRILDAAANLFMTEGYQATTTNAIASHAQVPIGSLYQFFPDKAAIVQALALRYTEQLHQHLREFNSAEMALPLSTYIECTIDITHQFFIDHPGYHVIFMEVQGIVPELQNIEDAADAKLIEEFATFLAQQDANLDPDDSQAIAYTLVKVIGTLLWLSLSQEPDFRKRLVREAKRLAFHYLQSYFSKSPRF